MSNLGLPLPQSKSPSLGDGKGENNLCHAHSGMTISAVEGVRRGGEDYFLGILPTPNRGRNLRQFTNP